MFGTWNDLIFRTARKAARRLRRIDTVEDIYIDELRSRGTYAFSHINKCGGTSVEKALGIPKIHDTAQQRRDKLGAANWTRLWTFSVVRHPFDKVCSHYRYRVKTNQTGLAQHPLSLNEWVSLSYGQQDPRYFDQPLMFAPCIEWLRDEAGEIMVSHVSRLEDIVVDWPVICRRIGMQMKLDQMNETRRDEATVALSPDNRKLLCDIFAGDMAAFGY